MCDPIVDCVYDELVLAADLVSRNGWTGVRAPAVVVSLGVVDGVAEASFSTGRGAAGLGGALESEVRPLDLVRAFDACGPEFRFGVRE